MRPLAPPVVLLAAVLLSPQSNDSSADERYVAELRARIARGDVEAEVALGNLYESGQSTLAFDPARAAEWYRRAADKGHAGAQFNLANMYLDGHGVPKDAGHAVTWYRKAADQGDALAQFSLASIYETGVGRVPRDVAGAATWYRRAADQGLATAQYRLGMMLVDGRGVSRDASQAVAWLRKAADQDETDAQIEVGSLLSAPRGRFHDAVEAHVWLNLAASRWKNQAQRLKAVRLRDAVAATMTPSQLAEAYRRATEWQDDHALPKRPG
jgi:TPR repeat protein